ncbi:MAG: 1,4-dihydroxy-6-naphthoate synthase [Deltaproteobacteria bacterium]|jgi:1,4-dihydroxy-6-naphthoate synthase|nr:1,4-dihydroxy-6-naphthoate synthase [Deltaproteobacteria bacterium]
MALSLGISPCPNDTYIFAALVEGRLERSDGPGPLNAHFADVDALNSAAKAGRFDIVKVSASAVADIVDDYVVLNAGGALGRGCGPLLVAPASKAVTVAGLRDAAIAVPGLLTTANLLLSLHGGFSGPRRELIFHQIMPELAAGRVDAGVIIHESRFTYADHGLACVLDLGRWWEETTGAPLPLGVIVGKRSLGEPVLRRVEAGIRRSLELANARPEAVMPFVRAHAQEMDSAVLARHIATFVNEFSLNLGEAGRDAVRRLVTRAAEARGIPLAAGKALCLPA